MQPNSSPECRAVGTSRLLERILLPGQGPTRSSKANMEGLHLSPSTRSDKHEVYQFLPSPALDSVPFFTPHSLGPGLMMQIFWSKPSLCHLPAMRPWTKTSLLPASVSFPEPCQWPGQTLRREDLAQGLSALLCTYQPLTCHSLQRRPHLAFQPDLPVAPA